MRQKSFRSFSRAAMMLLMMLLTAQTAWAATVTPNITYDGVAASDVTVSVTYTYNDGLFFSKDETRHETLSNGSRFYPVNNTVVTIAVTSSASITTAFSATYDSFGQNEPLTVNTDGNNCTFTPAPGLNTTLNITVRPAGVQVYYVHYSTGDEFGVSGSMADQTFYVGVPQTLSPCGFTRSLDDMAFDFAGWATINGGPVVYSDGQEVTNIAAAGETITLYATWQQVQTFTVHFDANGGEGTMADQKIRSGVTTPLNANTFTREGYVFKGWNQHADGSNLFTYADGANFTGMGIGTYTLYAQWAPAYTVRFDANGGTGTMADMACKVGTTHSLTANTFTRSGYIFTGWNTATDGSGNAYTDGQSIRNLSETPGDIVTLYAQWTVPTTLASGSVNMPATGFSAVTIPVGTTSFKVYDDGGASGNYSTNCDGYLLLIAPAGCTLQLTGTVNTKPYNNDNYLTVHDGSTASTVLLDKFRTTLSLSEGDHSEVITNNDIGTVSTTDRRMLLYFRSGSETEAGLDLTVTVVESTAPDDHFTDNGDGTYTINTTKGWNLFCDALEGGTSFTDKTVKLNNDISVTRMAGSSSHKFTGTFNGQGNTLTVNYGTSDSPITEQYAAPLRYMDGGSIENLHVTGNIYTSAKYAAGFVSNQFGTVAIRNCISSVNIQSSVSGDGTHGGFVAANNSNATLTIEGCVFDGSLLGASTTCWGGFVGWRNHTVNISNSLFAPTSVNINADDSYTFARRSGSNITNTYYTATFGTAQGTHAYELSAAPERLCNGTGEGIVKTYRNNGLNYGLGFDNKYYLSIIPLSESEGVSYLTTYLQGETVPVEFKRTFKANQPYTLCLPFSFVSNETTQGKVYEFGGVDDQWVVQMNNIQMNDANAATVADQPYVFIPAIPDGGQAGDNVELTFSGTVSVGNEVAGHTQVGDWTMYGTYQRVDWSSGYWYGYNATNGVFSHCISGAYFPTFRCYLVFTPPTAARGTVSAGSTVPDQMTVEFNDRVKASTTGISNITVQFTKDEWYTLDGRKLNTMPTKKGIYVNKGRKVVIH